MFNICKYFERIINVFYHFLRTGEIFKNKNTRNSNSGALTRGLRFAENTSIMYLEYFRRVRQEHSE